MCSSDLSFSSSSPGSPDMVSSTLSASMRPLVPRTRPSWTMPSVPCLLPRERPRFCVHGVSSFENGVASAGELEQVVFFFFFDTSARLTVFGCCWGSAGFGAGTAVLLSLGSEAAGRVMDRGLLQYFAQRLHFI